MSKMMLRSSKPPLPRSPIRLRSCRALRSTTNTLQTPLGGLTKSQLPNPRSDVEGWEMRLEYHTISSELRALAKMVQQEIGNGDGGNPGNGEYSLNPRSPLFERGRLYEEYSARRNERLKRKKCGETGEEKKAVYGLGVRVESAKKRGVPSVLQSGRKTVPATPMMAQRGGGEKPRYMLRSMTTSNENMKPPPHLAMSVEKSVGGGEKKKTTVRSWTGDKALKELQEANVSRQCFPILKECAAKAIRVASDAEPDVAHFSGMAATILEGLFSSLNYFFSENGIRVCDYQLGLQHHVKRVAGSAVNSWTHTFSLWCLNPAVVFREIADRSLSIILTSDTR